MKRDLQDCNINSFAVVCISAVDVHICIQSNTQHLCKTVNMVEGSTSDYC
uniref:Uncharacterized protein n=1 Tax=Anguilla anguilla TaxID=7936 RepID=A0A0E9XMU7_ANGAN